MVSPLLKQKRFVDVPLLPRALQSHETNVDDVLLGRVVSTYTHCVLPVWREWTESLSAMSEERRARSWRLCWISSAEIDACIRAPRQAVAHDVRNAATSGSARLPHRSNDNLYNVRL